MDRPFRIGVACSVVGVAGYVVGVLVAYPGRAFSISAVMVGVTLLAIGEHRGVET